MIDVGVRSFDVSYARTKSLAEGKNYFRWRDLETDEEWFCTSIQGPTNQANVFLQGEGQKDHLQILTHLFIDGDTAFVRPPEFMPEDVYRPATELPASHYRMCARLSNTDFRCRNERTGELRHVSDFVGPAVLNWIDGPTFRLGEAHLFHDGKVVIDDRNVAHLVPA